MTMDMVAGDCLWILTVLLISQLAQVFIWLITVMVIFLMLPFLLDLMRAILGLLLEDISKEIP